MYVIVPPPFHVTEWLMPLIIVVATLEDSLNQNAPGFIIS